MQQVYGATTGARLAFEDFRRSELGATDEINAALDAGRLKDYADQRQRLNDVIAQTPFAQAEAIRANIRAINDELARGGLSDAREKGLIQALFILEGQLKDSNPAFEKTAETISEFALQAQRNIQDTLGDTLRDTLTGNFKSIGEAWKNMILDMIAQAAAAQLNDALFGKAGVGGNRSGGMLDDLWGAIKTFAGPFASGGRLGAGKWGIAGEAGPEIIHGPANVTPMSRGNTTIIQVAAGPTRGEVLSAIQMAVGASESRTMGRLRTVGVM